MSYPRVSSIDNLNNVAKIEFTAVGPGEVARSLGVENENGDIVAVLDFSDAGELLGIELLDVRSQLPRVFRE